MKRFAYFIAIFACALISSCRKSPLDVPVERSVLIYIAGDNDLNSALYRNIEQLKQGFLPKTGNILVYHDAEDALPRLFRLVKRGSEVVEELIEQYEEENSATPEVLTRCLLRMRELYPAEDYALILSSHATGWVPQGTRVRFSAPMVFSDVDYPQVKTFGKDGRYEMELEQLVSAIPYRLSFILFDTCLMGGIEVTYALRNVTDWMVASPTEIIAEGFPYDQIMQPIFLPRSDLERGLKEVCAAFYRYYSEHTGGGQWRSATIALYHTEALPQLAASVKSIFDTHRDKLNTFVPANHQLQRYDQLISGPHLFYDLDHFISTIATPTEYEGFSQIFEKVVIYKQATPFFMSIPITRFGGISTYIPVGQQSTLREAYKKTDWNKAVGLLE
ncbi:MAG: clostripain-related cysteine peptidase [Bacteroidales bacterium]|nr:clostripain-related cysteine peptidase [Bacteroidales bacterium]